MKKTLMTLSLLLSPMAMADTLQMPASPDNPPSVDYSQLPQKGLLKSHVLAQYGEPLSMSPPVGQPPISRWVYPDFVVFFEYDHVISAVIPGKPRQIHNRDELRRGGAQ